jgi:microcystin degradation protein MlrC
MSAEGSVRRILVCECKQEISSFNPAPSGYEDFVVSLGEALFARHRGVQSEVAGALSVLGQRGDLALIPGYGAQAITSGGTLGSADFRRIAGEFLAAVRAAGAVDAVYFSLHGAMAAVDEPDPEGYLLQETRRILGEGVPIVASFDLHGIITDRILRHCDAISIYHTYPHVDFFQTGERAARLLLRILDGARPVTARVPIPALVRGNELITETGLFGRMIRAAQAIEASPGGLSAGMFIGNPFTDVPELCSNVIVVADGDPARAEREALAIAADFWAVRERLQQPLVPLDEAARAACEVRGGTVVLVDAADATSSGAPGDSNAILRALHDAGYTGRVLAPLVDAPAVHAAMGAGVGRELDLLVGGTVDARHRPLPIRGRVRLISDGSFRNESDGGTWHGGPTAVVEAGGLTLVITSRPVSLYDRSLFLAHGQDPAQFNAVVVKSPHCQPRFYADWAARMINVDAPGATSANLRSLGHTRCARPIFPLDEGLTFEPRARLFSRG